MRDLYPDLMTVDLLKALNSAVDRGSVTDFVSLVSDQSKKMQEIVCYRRSFLANVEADIKSNEKETSYLCVESYSDYDYDCGGDHDCDGGGDTW